MGRLWKHIIYRTLSREDEFLSRVFYDITQTIGYRLSLEEVGVSFMNNGEDGWMLKQPLVHLETAMS